MSETRMAQVTSECAYVTVDTHVGRARQLLMKGAVFPADAPEARHLLDSGMAVLVGGDVTGGVDADGNPQAAVEGDAPKAGEAPKSTPTKKTGAAEKAGTAEKTASKDADVEALRARAVKAGMDPDEVKKASPEDLRAALKE
jgi:hypothetical protein